MERLIIEISQGGVMHREVMKFDHGKISVGRSFQNDLILSDPYASAIHLYISIDENGKINVQDNGSLNGTYYKKRNEVISKMCIESGDILIVGRTRLKIFLESHSVSATKVLIQDGKLLKIISKRRIAWGLLILAVGSSSISTYLESWENTYVWNLGLSAIFCLILILSWSAFWAFIGRVIKYRVRLLPHLAVTSLVFLLFLPADTISSYIGFYLSKEWIHFLMSFIFSGLLIIFLLNSHLKLATLLSRKDRSIVSGVFTSILLLAVWLAINSYKSEFSTDARFYSVLKPPLITVPHGVLANQFLRDSEQIFEINK